MSKLEKFPSGSEVVCSGIKTIDQIEESGSIGKDDYDLDLYAITEHIVDANLEGDHVFLHFD